jgi:predicted dehydrogenase
MSHNPSRRQFLAASVASVALASTNSAARASVNPNDRIRLGFIGLGTRAQEHVSSAMNLHKANKSVEIAYLCDVFNKRRESTVAKVQNGVGGTPPTSTGDYRDILRDNSVDAVVIATPDHWHARQTIDTLEAGKHVYCEKPMTHSVEEALAVLAAWKKSGKVMQVGVQSTQLPVWQDANSRICNGQLGKILGYQTEFFRNSAMGQWRYYQLTSEMTPKNIDWKMFLGSEFGLAPEVPFDRARFGQWRCYWDYGAGLFTDLFVHRTTTMLAATGLRFPSRVVGAGGIYLEYDGRDVPDVATVVADFAEGAQGIVTATMCCEETPIKQTIRGHDGSFVFGNGEEFEGYDFVAERPQVTHDSKTKSERIEVGGIPDLHQTHFANFINAVESDKPHSVRCSPELGAAAMVLVKLGAKSYREGKVFHFDPQTLTVSDGNSGWAQRWEKMSRENAPAKQVAGWKAGTKGSILFPEEYQKLAGPWVDGVDPDGNS